MTRFANGPVSMRSFAEGQIKPALLNRREQTSQMILIRSPSTENEHVAAIRVLLQRLCSCLNQHRDAFANPRRICSPYRQPAHKHASCSKRYRDHPDGATWDHLAGKGMIVSPADTMPVPASKIKLNPGLTGGGLHAETSATSAIGESKPASRIAIQAKTAHPSARKQD